MRLTLPAHSPFSLTSVINSHGWIALAPFERDGASGGFVRIEQLDSGRVVEVWVREAEGGVNVYVPGRLKAAERREVEQKVGWMVGLDQDLSPFYQLAKGEPRLARVQAQAQGRLLRSPTLFEDVIKTILTTNTAWGGTIRMVAALVAQFGDSLPGDEERRAFPTPARLAESDEATLRGETRLGYRAPYVLALACDVADGALGLEALKTTTEPTPALYKRLLAIKGVGPYAAAHMLMLLERYDRIPIDSWALTMVSREWHDGAPVGHAEVEAAFDRWGAWRGLAYWLWDWAHLSA